MSMFRTLIMMILAFSFQAAGLQASGNIPVGELTTEWQLDREVNGLQIYLKRSECRDQVNGIFIEAVLVRFVNTTSTNLKAAWDMEFWYDGQCRTCDPSADAEYRYTVDIPAGAVVEGNCAKDCPRELKYHIRFLNYDHIAKLTQYEMRGLTVSPK